MIVEDHTATHERLDAVLASMTIEDFMSEIGGLLADREIEPAARVLSLAISRHGIEVAVYIDNCPADVRATYLDLGRIAYEISESEAAS